MKRQDPSILRNAERIARALEFLLYGPEDRLISLTYDDGPLNPGVISGPIVRTSAQSCVLDHLKGKKTYAVTYDEASPSRKWFRIDVSPRVGLVVDRTENLASGTRQVIDAIHESGIPIKSIMAEMNPAQGYRIWVMHKVESVESVRNFIWRMMDGLGHFPHDVAINAAPAIMLPSGDDRDPIAACLPLGRDPKSRHFWQLVDHDLQDVADVPSMIEGIAPCRLPHAAAMGKCPSLRKSRRPSRCLRRPSLPPANDLLVPPPLTRDMALVMRGCALLKEFKQHPDLTRVHEWQYATQILMSFGDIGKDWVQHLSFLDEDNYNEKRVARMIDRVNRHDAHGLDCRSWGCNLCPMASPLQLLNEERRNYRTFFDIKKHKQYPPAEPVDLDEIRPRFAEELRSFITGNTPRIALSNFPLGGGKTSIAIDEIAKAGVRALFLCPTHALAKDVAEQFGKDGIWIIGRDSLHEDPTNDFKCDHLDAIKSNIALGRSSTAFCSEKKCPIREDCSYLRQYEQAAQAQIVILAHDHLRLGDEKLKTIMDRRQLMVIDESFLRPYRQEERISKAELNILGRALMEANLRNVANTLIKPLLHLVGSADKGITVPPIHLYPKTFHRVDSIFERRFPRTRNPLRTLHRAGQDGLTAWRINENQIGINVPAFLPDHVPVLILDATARREHYQLLLARPVQTINPAEGKLLRRHATTIQVVGGNYSNSSTLAYGEITDIGERASRFMKKTIRNQESYGIIATKQMEKYLIKEGDFPEDRILHFNALRGLNTFNDAQDVFILGYQGVKYYDLADEARVLFDQGWSNVERQNELQLEKEYMPLRMTNGMSCEVYALNPQNPFVAAYYDLCVRGEVEQAIGRARLYGSSTTADRRIYIIGNMPTSLEIDHVMEMPDDKTKDKLMKSARTLIRAQGRFTISELMAASGSCERQIRSRIDELVVSFGLVEIPGSHTQKDYVALHG